MRLSSTKTSLLILAIFAILITKVVAHEEEDCEEDSHDQKNVPGQNDPHNGDKSNYPPYIISSGVPYPAPTGGQPTVVYPPQPPQPEGPSQSAPLPPVQPPAKTDIPGLHPPEQNSASEHSMLVSLTVYSIIISIAMTLMF